MNTDPVQPMLPFGQQTVPSADERSTTAAWAQETTQEMAKRPHIFVALAQNALTVAHSLRDNYFRNTAALVARFREHLTKCTESSKGGKPLFTMESLDVGKHWDAYRGEEIAFIDGGVGSVAILSQVPMLLRVGTYKVKAGERMLSQREEFGFYPVILGDLNGGSKERKDYPEIVRIIAELLAVLHTLNRYPELDVLVLHGPLVYLMGQYAGHVPFTDEDVDLFLRNYGLEQRLKEQFQAEARRIYPQMTEQWRAPSWGGRLEGRYEPLCFICFLLWEILRVVTDARRPKRTPVCGVAERGTLSEFIRRIAFQRVLEDDPDFFNTIFGRHDINSAQAAVERLGYNDPLLLSMLLRPGEYSEPFDMDKYSNLRGAHVADVAFDFRELHSDGQHPFPKVIGCYVHVSDTTFPLRVEVFGALAAEQIREVAQRVGSAHAGACGAVRHQSDLPLSYEAAQWRKCVACWEGTHCRIGWHW